MTRILIVHLANGLGLHFFDWSLNFLSGTMVIDNPMVDNTAHNFKLTKVSLPADLDRFANAAGLTVVQSCPDVSLTQNLIEDSEHRDQIQDQIYQNHLQVIERAFQLDFKVIVVDWSAEHWLLPTYQTRYPLLYSTLEPGTREQVNQEWVEMFFPDASNQWTDLNAWDKREILALCLRPMTLRANPAQALVKHFDTRIRCIETKELWSDMDDIIADFVTVDPAQLARWQPMYQQWRQIHDTKFSQDYWSILHDIVQGVSRDLSPYQIDFTKEALIQHGLIFAYNLNLKTWQLDQLPTDTQSLTLLLEPNIHSRDFTYNLHY